MSEVPRLRAYVTQDFAVNRSSIARGVLATFRLGSWGLRHASSPREARVCRLLAAVGRLVFCHVVDHGALDPYAQIGPRLELAHNLAGTIVHPTAVLGADCVLFQGVTIGADNYSRGEYRAPHVGDRVNFAPGCCVLGAIAIGDDVVIGANAVVLEDVPDRATAVGVPARVLPNDVPRRRHPLVVASRRRLGRTD